ncbi:MAG: phosphoenolpyruvate--protein phosphotransferase [Anaerolineales bacterium]|nr:phosphoenolpyruvate--protein phosphotransferase [Anaerolineales bacterium]MDW8161335.1 phosphoenolpyruvate--protein phosphotransferase [Anaerolineales bacterium]
MVGLVIVSHSRQLAEGLLGLARQVAPRQAKIAIAAGIGEEHQEIGTDALEIAAAIRSVYSEEGVLVLMDLGSAVLSAEMALEFLSEAERQRVRLCPAPVVEGTLAAAAQLALSADLDKIYAEALIALTPKQLHLGYSPSPYERGARGEGWQSQPSTSAQALPSESIPEDELSLIVRLENPHGLHARPATQLLQTAARFDAQVWVANLDRNTPAVEAVSLNALLALGATQGQRLRVIARGPQAAEALAAIQDLMDAWQRHPVLEEAPPMPLAGETKERLEQTAPEEKAIRGVPIAEGIAVAPIHFLQTTWVEPPSSGAASPRQEWQRLQAAIQKVEGDLQVRFERLRGQLGEEKAAIFQAQALFLRDPLLLERARQLILKDNLNAWQAWKQACDEAAQAFQQADDSYLRQRALDILDITRLVLANFGETKVETLRLSEAAILAAEELTPNQVAELDPQTVRGVILAGGGATSHSAILLRGLGIPAVGGVDLARSGLKDGDWIGIDGQSGEVWLCPGPAVITELEEKARRWKESRQRLLQSARQPAQTRDGKRVEILANVGSLAEGKLALTSGAEGIGVLRTEFLYQNRPHPPTEPEQVAVYCQLAEWLKPHAVVVRTLDVGGDKLPAYLSLPPEANPYLGLRGIRVSLRYPDIFLTQIRAILRAATDYPIHLLLPMVATLEEWEQAKAFVCKAHEQLDREGIPHGYPVPMGIMVETPASVYLAEHFAKEVEFFSIGTNDLTQYTLAAERGNPALSEYNDALHPAILRQIQQVISAAHACGKRVTVCGEVASLPEALPILVGLGTDELSLNPNAIPQQKAILARVESGEAQSLAQEVLKCRNVGEVRQLAQRFLAEIGGIEP